MIVYDCEIKKMILGRREQVQPGIEYCAGWSDFPGMGISVVCAFDTDTQEMHTLLPEDSSNHAEILQNLINKTDYVVGFNNHSFDDKLLAAFGITVPASKSYDIYVEVIKGAGLANTSFADRKGYKLDDLARANGIPGKNIDGGGALAPVLFQTGQLEKLFSYCANDVSMTAAVLQCILDLSLICPRYGTALDVATPKDVLGAVQTGLF